MENVTVNILGCAIVFFFGFYAGIIYRRKNTKESRVYRTSGIAKKL